MNDRQAAWIRHTILLVLTAVQLVPFYIAVVNAFKPAQSILDNALSIPFDRMTVSNFVKTAITPSFNVFRAYGTSLWITGASVVLLIVLGSMMSFVIARRKHPLLTGAFLLLLSGLMIPPQVILLPLVQMLAKLHLMFTPQGLILYYLGFYIPLTAFTYVGFIRTLSRELDESARMDGANDLIIFWRIIFPLIRPATASVTIFLFIFIWNDFVNPLIILGSTKGYTVTTGIYRAIGQYAIDWEQVYPMVDYAIVPLIALFVFLQRHFIAGLTEGAVKG